MAMTLQIVMIIINYDDYDYDHDDGDDGAWDIVESKTEMEMRTICILVWWFMLFELEQVSTLL